MMSRKISMIVCVDQEGGFGKAGKIPWNHPEDLKHFSKTTKNSVCLMGRTTYEDMSKMRVKKKKGKSILPNRDCFVLSNTISKLPDATIVKSLRQALDESDSNKEFFIIGGQRLFTQGLAVVTRVYMTIVPDSYDCDRFFCIEALNKGFEIGSATEKDGLIYVVYHRTKKFR